MSEKADGTKLRSYVANKQTDRKMDGWMNRAKFMGHFH